jgi:hypothetical protein
MKIEVEGQEFLIKEISYADKLGLHGEFADVYRNGADKVSQKEFNVLLGHTAEIAFSKPEEAFKDHEYDFQLKILMACMMEYLGLSASAKKESGG